MDPNNNDDEDPIEEPNVDGEDVDIDDQSIIEVLTLRGRLISLGYDDEQIRPILAAMGMLVQVTSQLTLFKDRVPKDDDDDLNAGIAAFGNADNNQSVLLHQDILMPWWENFVEALSLFSTSDEGQIWLSFSQIQLGQEVVEMLLRALKTTPIQSLVLRNTGMGRDAIRFAVNALKTNAALHVIDIRKNLIESERDAISLMKAVNEHPTADAVFLVECGLGQNDAVMKHIVTALRNLREVSLEDNRIGSYGARLIAKCLARNPEIVILTLSSNLLDDKDATWLAAGLKRNTTLKHLRLTGNQITLVGINALFSAIFNTRSFDAICDSNHNCWIENDDDTLPNHNKYMDPKTNRKLSS